jgi:hypothetical protein
LRQDGCKPELLLKAWMPMAPDQMQQACAKLFGALGGSKPGGCERLNSN